jgi:hypothetical protein
MKQTGHSHLAVVIYTHLLAQYIIKAHGDRMIVTSLFFNSDKARHRIPRHRLIDLVHHADISPIATPCPCALPRTWKSPPAWLILEFDGARHLPPQRHLPPGFDAGVAAFPTIVPLVFDSPPSFLLPAANIQLLHSIDPDRV